ncbi:unnamed protein product [marine sediment metagenome]|uniref:Shikimate kinase n=1 Tax=marine sediment metagenome TaxID=412755 RepID=X0T7A8_9ZZZZ
MKRNIALTGFMGSGKSAVGKVLAGRLGRRFVELDDMIEETAGRTIPDIFRQDGEIAFRELEIEATRRVSKGADLVIACGGGIVLNMINIDRLRETSRIVYLTASPRIILKRVSIEEGQRPLLEVDNPTLTIGELLKFRKPFYERAADIVIPTSRSSIDRVADLIIRSLKEDEGFNL